MLKIKIVEAGGAKVAVCENEDIVIKDGQSALDFAINIGYEHDCYNIALNKAAITDDFFKLSTGIAGEVVQKFINYGYRLAIIGDFAGYTSKPLHDFIYECNNGNHLYFVASEDEAVRKLGGYENGYRL